MPHGRGLAAIYPAWLRRAQMHAPERFARVASWLTGGISSDAESEIRALIRAMGLADSMGALGFVAEDADHICANISGNLANDPIEGLDATAICGVVMDAIGEPAGALLPLKPSLSPPSRPAVLSAASATSILEHRPS